MRGRYGIHALLSGLVLALAPEIAFASDLVVAVAPPAPPPADTGEREEKPPPPKKRESVALGAALYMLNGTAIDDLRADRLAFMARPALEAYVSIGLGDVSLVIGGPTLAIEVYAYDGRTSTNYPALLAMGIHHQRWLVELAGGASLASDDSEGTFNHVATEPIPSPRAELRGGLRFGEMMELRGMLGVEERIANEGDGVTRVFTGLAFGIGAN